MLPVIPADKANHACYGGLLACLGGLHSIAAGAALCAVLAIAKEVYDRTTGRGHPELMDALATMAGGAVVLLPVLALRLVGAG